MSDFHVEVDVNLSLDKRRAGGLGIFMTVKLMDTMLKARRPGTSG